MNPDMDDRDIVERLRAVPHIMSEALLCQHAADEIERLRSNRDELRRDRDNLVSYLNGISRQTAAMVKAHTVEI